MVYGRYIVYDIISLHATLSFNLFQFCEGVQLVDQTDGKVLHTGGCIEATENKKHCMGRA